ncbi:MAG TPA: hypothetical protein VFQ35_20780 [Polyangiaceae bacterium]|nr:hypothetical protein [Polyangiaceae bacterium]
MRPQVRCTRLIALLFVCAEAASCSSVNEHPGGEGGGGAASKGGSSASGAGNHASGGAGAVGGSAGSGGKTEATGGIAEQGGGAGEPSGGVGAESGGPSTGGGNIGGTGVGGFSTGGSDTGGTSAGGSGSGGGNTGGTASGGSGAGGTNGGSGSGGAASGGSGSGGDNTGGTSGGSGGGGGNGGASDECARPFEIYSVTLTGSFYWESLNPTSCVASSGSSPQASLLAQLMSGSDSMVATFSYGPVNFNGLIATRTATATGFTASFQGMCAPMSTANNSGTVTLTVDRTTGTVSVTGYCGRSGLSCAAPKTRTYGSFSGSGQWCTPEPNPD